MKNDHTNLPFLTRQMLKSGQNMPIALRLTVHSTSSVVIKIIGVTPDSPFIFQRVTTGDLTRETQDFRLPEIPIMVSLTTDDTAVVRGDIFAKLELLLNGTPYFTLAAGYVTNLSGPSWPNGKIEDSLSGKGKFRLVTGSVPSAGAEISVTVPSNLVWIINSVMIRLDADATSTSRRVHLLLNIDGGASAIRAMNPNNITVNQAITMSIADYGARETGINQNIQQVGIATPFPLVAGGTITTQTQNLQAGDQYDAPLLILEQFIVPV